METITVNGITYKVRYAYAREDGSRWYVLETNGLTVDALQGPFGDEWPAS